jgi:4-alpha-glucanotransferase
MSAPIRFCLALHNHQPVGNFDGVFEQAYYDSYLPFLDVFESYAHLRLVLHTSGPLMEWLDERHPEYVDRLARLVREGRLEIMGGPFYEPILTMIPGRDRVGQIRRYSEWLHQRLGADVQGMWMPERVWEQVLTSDLAVAGMRYTLLDDFHFRNAGVGDDELFRHYLTEDDGHVLQIFPGSERLRYLIPFADPQQTIDYLGEIASRHDNAVVVFGDDGEKFGTWPETKRHVYDNGWLRRFFDCLSANQDWVRMVTLSEVIEELPPLGKVYLPDGSYREMTEWAFPVPRQVEYDEVVHEMEHDGRWPRVKRFVRGGFWRNFKIKYPEANEMYARMMQVSRRLETARQAGMDGRDYARAQRHLFKGQCNCSYWHGAFGGIYLPHLRNAVYAELIRADSAIDQAMGKVGSWVEATADDYNFDQRPEVRLANDRLLAWLAPAAGGQMYELDVRSIAHNLLATLARRPEAYHRKVLAGARQGDDHVSSIHDRVVFKQEGLEQRVQYDAAPRKSLIDHFYPAEASLEQLRRNEVEERGDFTDAPYEARIRRDPDRIQVQMTRSGHVFGRPIRITKGVTLHAGSSSLQLAYQLEGLSRDEELHFAVELNLAGMPGGADDRYYQQGEGQRLGQLGHALDLSDLHEFAAVDEWLGIEARLSLQRPTRIWTFPIETVSQSEGGFELVHQSIVVMPHWMVRGDEEGRWSVVMELALDTTRAESRWPQAEQVAVS